MAEEDVKVLHMWASPFGIRVLIALEEKAVEYELRLQDLANKSQLLLDSNHIYKKVPVLIHNGKSICESKIILEYIDDAWNGESSFMPSDPYDRAQARFWADFHDTKVGEQGAALIVRGNEEAQEEGKKNMEEYLKILEGVLGENEYFGGDTFGYLDIVVISGSSWYKALETLGNWKFPDLPKLKAWEERCSQRESVLKVIPRPEKILEFGKVLRNMSIGGGQ